jgi:hypothetical protein
LVQPKRVDASQSSRAFASADDSRRTIAGIRKAGLVVQKNEAYQEDPVPTVVTGSLSLRELVLVKSVRVFHIGSVLH